MRSTSSHVSRRARALSAAAGVLFAATTAAAQQVSAQRESGTGAVWDDRPSVRFGENSRIEIKARVQSDVLLRNDADPDSSDLSLPDRVSLHRKRIGVEGVLFGRVEFQAERELRDDNPWRDVFADVRVHRSLRIRAGQFKVPFSLEQLTSGAELDFVTRASAVSDLAPSRDIGVMAHGRLARKAVKYEAGVFETDRATRLWAQNAVRTLAGRVTIAPLEDGKSRGSDALEFSAAVMRSDLPDSRTGMNGHLVMGDTFFHHMYVNGARTRLGASASWNGRHAAVRGEVLRTIEARLGQAIDGTDLSNLISQGGYITGIWHAIPGKGRRRGDFPFRALDVAARLDRITFGSANQSDEAFLNPRADHVATIGKNTWTFGANWYVNRWVKVQADTVRERLVDPLQLLPLSAEPYWSTVLRFQVAM